MVSADGGNGGRIRAGFAPWPIMKASRWAACSGSVTQMTLPSSTDMPIACWAWALRSGPWVSSKLLGRAAPEDQVQLPGQVRGVADARAHPLPGEEGHQVGGVAGQQAGPPPVGPARAAARGRPTRQSIT